MMSRPRLFDRLEQGINSTLTLVSAPAGFGKTTLVREWVSKCNRAAAWLSLDYEDNDPVRFLTYLVAALRTAAEGIGERALALLQLPERPPIDSVLAILLNEIAVMPNHLVLVLDDYHVIDNPSIDGALTFILDHMPSQMQLVIATREDPQLPIARLRGRGQLTELRAADLRLTPDEASVFLNRVMGLNLSTDDIVALETRTEGWITGLQLAALSLQGRSDTTSFIEDFTGSHRFVLDYLVEEVLRRQPQHVRHFLLQTAILDRLNGSLCDAVTGRDDGRATLDALERGNLFLIPLDDRRYWYRYHHLFADVLRARLMEEGPHLIPVLHQRASTWCEQNSMPSDAVCHALAAKDFERAASLIELAGPMLEENPSSVTWLGWIRALPNGLITARPVLSAWYASALLGIGEMEAAEARLRDAERWLESAGGANIQPGYPASRPVVADEERCLSLPATIAIARAYCALARGDVPGTVRYAQQALELLPEGDQLKRGQATALLGITHWANGDLEAANRVFAGFVMRLRTAGRIPDAISAAGVLAEIRTALGRLREAVSTLQQLLQSAVDQGEPLPQITADLYRGLGELDLERGELGAAAQHLLRSSELGQGTVLPVWQYRWHIAQARLSVAQGTLDSALNWLQAAERSFVRFPSPDVNPIPAMRARIWVMQGRLTEAMDWVRDQALSVDDEVSYLRESDHMTLARILIACHRVDPGVVSLDGTLQLLARLLAAAEDGKRTRSVIEILVLLALTREAQHNISAALVPLERALSLAESEGYVQIFVDEGLPMERLLQEAAQRRVRLNYVRRLQIALGQRERGSPSNQLLTEALSERELEVLRLLRTDISGPEIARTLVVSLSTVRTHTQSIYGKLGVNNRRAAIRRAEELDLL